VGQDGQDDQDGLCCAVYSDGSDGLTGLAFLELNYTLQCSCVRSKASFSLGKVQLAGCQGPWHSLLLVASGNLQTYTLRCYITVNLPKLLAGAFRAKVLLPVVPSQHLA
jgi:hypothetical protein